MNLTVPMQSYRKLLHGDYDVTLSSRGRWSQKVRLPIRPGLDTEYSLRAQDRPVREISIDGAMAALTADFDGPAVLWSRDGQLRRYASDEKNDWTLNASKVETQVIRVAPTDASHTTESVADGNSTEETMEIDFTVSPPVDSTPWVRSRWHENPQIATPARTLRSAIDVDADGVPDTIVAAMNKSALLALAGDGKVLWAKAYDLNGRLRDGNPTTLKREVRHIMPGVIDIHDVGDRDDDGITDLVVQMVHIQPGIQNDVCLALLSGRTGEVLNAVKPPAIQLKDGSEWPYDEQLQYYYRRQRQTGPMRFEENRFRIDTAYQHDRISRRTSGTSSFAVPSPLRIIELSDRPVAIYTAGDTCHAYDMLTGDQLFSPIKLGTLIDRGPKIVRLGKDGDATKYGLMFRERNQVQKGPAGRTDAARLAVYDLDGQLIWEQMQEAPHFREAVVQANQVDWPLIVDTNGDGRDEFLTPVLMKMSKYRSSWKRPLMLMDAATGKELWDLKKPNVSDSYRLAITADIDNDGTRDFVAASLHGSTPLDLKPGETTDIGIASVYVDWISGATGQPIMWASHSVNSVPQEIGRADIDAIRCKLNSMDPKIVEVDFVSGGIAEVEKGSMTIQFHPSSHEAVSVASGLTHCASSVAADTNTRVFYKRPGPFLDGEETLVFLRNPQPDAIRVGESEVVATWTTDSANGSTPTKLAGLKGLTAERFSVINVDQQRTVWSTVASPSGRPAFYPIRRTNGSYDFLASAPRYDDVPELLDGDTGKKLWAMSDVAGGRIMQAFSVTTSGRAERFLIVGDGQTNLHDGNRPNALRMSMVDATYGRVLWHRYFLHGAARYNTPNHLKDIQFADVNNDGVLDVIAPEQLQEERKVRIAVFDGTDGQQLWMTEHLKDGMSSGYLPGPFSFISVEGRPRIAHVVQDDTTAKLVLRDALNGTILTEAELPEELSKLTRSDRDYRARYGGMVACSTDGEARLSLCCGASFTMCASLVTVQDSHLSFGPVSADDKPMITHGSWLKDVGGDETAERIELKHNAILCKDVHTNNLVWKTKLPKGYDSAVTFDDANRTAWIHDKPTLTRNRPGPPIKLIDLTNGEVLAEFDAGRLVDHKLPSVFRNEQGITLVWPLSGGTRVQRLASAETAQSSFVGPTQVDARRIGHWHISQHDRSIQDIVFTGIRSALILCAFTLPFLYVGTMLMQRRWSLSFFLLAPLVLMLFLLVVRTSWFGVITLLEGYSWLATPLGLWIAVRPPFDAAANEQMRIFKPKIKWTFLLTLMLISFVALMATEYSARNDLLTYPIAARDLLFGAIATTSYAFKYWFGFSLLFLFFSKFQKPTDQKQVSTA